MVCLKGKYLLSLILKLVWNSFIYIIWRERNRRLFQGRKSNEETIIGSIKDVIQLRLLERNVNSSSNVYNILYTEWCLRGVT
ncbi:hypothetical protein E1A91_D08G157300v1 [Gossypium mustelinum]|uniref:Uncharacterized protein n=1 Tax=Gossypium mustelinum TaxID=34275 RepID=A0A5D2TY64_GOSMU|nr:hypothetical protein E1A91_D08G157300v1 [Gossypium mustelinum]